MNHSARSPRTIGLPAALLVAALAGGIAGGPAMASTFTVAGDVTYVYGFDYGPPDGQIVLDTFSRKSPSSVASAAHSDYTSNPVNITRGGRVDARATFGAVGLSGHTGYSQNVPPFVNGDSYNAIRAGGVAVATFTDVLVTGPGGGSVSTRLRLHLRGALTSPSSETSTETDGIVGSASISVGVSVNGSFVGFGNLSRTSVNGGTSEISAQGLFAGFGGDGVLTTANFLVPLNTPVTVELRLQLSLQSLMQDTAIGAASSSASFYQSLSFATDGPVFDLPAGYTANSPEGGIANNTHAAPGTDIPELNLKPVADGVVLTWSAAGQATQLESSTNILGPWTDVPTSPGLTNSNFGLTWTLTPDSTYFRLRAPQ